MADKMTLQQVSDGLRTNADDLNRIDSMPMLADHLRNMAGAIDAHLTGMAEPVGYANGNDFSKGDDGFIVRRKGDTEFFTVPVYAVSPAPCDWNAAQAAIGELRNICRFSPMSSFTRDRIGAELDKLTAALPEHAHG